MKDQTFYKVDETFTSRTDIDPYLKFVLININNKLNIPKNLLTNGVYTFSISNVSKEMGIPRDTVYWRFQMLEHLKAIKRTGTKRTIHGEVVTYEANQLVIKSIMQGNITINKTLMNDVKTKLKQAAASLPKQQGSCSKQQATCSKQQATLPPVTSTQSKYTDNSTQKIIPSSEILEDWEKTFDDFKTPAVTEESIKPKSTPEQRALFKEHLKTLPKDTESTLYKDQLVAAMKFYNIDPSNYKFLVKYSGFTSGGNESATLRSAEHCSAVN